MALSGTQEGFSGHTRIPIITIEAVKQMCSILSKSSVSYVKVLWIPDEPERRACSPDKTGLSASSLQREVSTSELADFDLKHADPEYVVATADGAIIDAVEKVTDLPQAVLEEKGSWAEMII